MNQRSFRVTGVRARRLAAGCVAALLVAVGACSAPAPAPAPSAAAAAPRAVQVGVTVRLAGLEQAREAGFEFVELATSELAMLSEPEWEAAKRRIREIGLPVPVTNLFIPGDIKVVGPDLDPARQMEYVRRAFDRLAEIGVEHIVFGSGGARRVPDGFPREQAFAQLVEFARRIAPEAQARGITVLVEPLRSAETNIVNTAREGWEWVRAVNHPNFQLMVDYFHLASENEDPRIIVEARQYIHHLHMANPEGRRFPLGWHERDYAPFFRALRQVGYDGRISIEASTDDFVNDGRASIRMMREAFDTAFALP
jgi:D-psicose/D-tagatose/L-ribulose 3-epimerase